jgi:ATP-dependent RNA/DNA helicase IGHMBP2
MSVNEQLLKTFELIKIERQADLEQYRQKVLMLPLHRKTKEGKCWYPVRIKRDYIGTGERLIIEVERTKEIDQPHVFSSGKVVSIFSNAKGSPDKSNTGGVINYVRDNLMVITLHQDDLPEWIEDGQIGVDVMFDENSYREMEATLKLVMKAEGNRIAKLRNILLGAEKALFKNPTENIQQLQNTKLNPSQQEALQKISSAEDVAIIHGPPGTGKTTTLVQAIRQTLSSEPQVLVCAASNAAVDLLTDKLSEEGLRVLRIGHPARVTEQSLSKTLDARIAAHEYYKDLRSMRKRMEQLRGQAMKYKKNFGYREREQRKLLMDEVRALKADADVLEFYIVNDLLQNSDAICCTLVSSSNHLLRGKKFSSVFIDEAAQALEPACWIPILKADRVIFAGDHCQLPPTIKSIDAAKAGLAKTLFEKCIETQPHTAVMLKTQYRMHEDIMHFSSQYFYGNELIAHESVRLSTIPDHLPIDFIDTAGCGYNEKQDPETLSRLNQEEATLLMSIVETLVEEIGVNTWLEKKYTLGIITPYSAQVEILRKLAEASSILNEITSFISINTVDAFQGQERDIIAISFVRSNDKAEVGFLADIRRTNVAMTRAKKKLIIVGDSATLGSHPFYLELLDYVQQKNYYRSAFEIER